MAIQKDEGTTRRLDRLYKNRDGEVTKKLSDQVAAVIWRTIEGGHTLEGDLVKLFGGELPEPSMGLCAAAFGLNTVVGNSVAGNKTTDMAQLIGVMKDRLEAIEEGEWAEGREGGPRLKFVLDAWVAYFVSRNREVSDEQKEVMRQKILAGAPSSKELLDQAPIRALYDAAEAQRVVARAQASKEAAAEATVDDKFLTV